MQLKPFEAIVLKHPTEEETVKGIANTTIEKLFPPFLAKNEQAAYTIVSRDIPDYLMSDIDRVEIVIRPF